MKRIAQGIIAIIIAIISVFTFVTQVKAATTLYEPGYELCDYEFGSCIGPRTEYGTLATILIPNQNVLSGDTVAFWTGIDEFPGNPQPSGTHWWAQAGYALGTAPNGVTYSTPQMYVETNGSSYSFRPTGSAAWNSYHTFQVTIFPTTGGVDFVIDGVDVAQLSMPLNFNQGGQIHNIMEVHQSGASFDTSSGSWSNIQYYECGAAGQSCWHYWNCLTCGVLAVSTPPYYVRAYSVQNFDVYTNVATGGGGRGGTSSCRVSIFHCVQQ